MPTLTTTSTLPEWTGLVDWGVDTFTDIYGVVHPSTRVTPVAGGGLVVGDTYYPPVVSNTSALLGLLIVGGVVVWLVTK